VYYTTNTLIVNIYYIFLLDEMKKVNDNGSESNLP